MSHASRELFLFAYSDANLYRQRILPIIQNLQKKVKKGTYDSSKALTLWKYAADDAAVRYGKEFGGDGKKMFSVADRKETAKELAEYYDEHVMEALAQKKNPVSKDLPARFRVAMDANGNKYLRIESRHGSISVRTNGNLPYVHSSVDLGAVPLKQYWQVLDAATSYLYRYGTKKQKIVLDNIVDDFLLHDPVHKKNPVPSAIREAKLNVKEAKAHLDVVDKALRGKNPVTKKRKAKKKPVVKKPRITKPKVKKAIKRFSEFHLNSPDKKTSVQVPDFEPSKARWIGIMKSISYTTVRGGKTEKYIHEFKSGLWPAAFVDTHGNIFSHNGNSRFTKRGFVDGKNNVYPPAPDYSVSLVVGYIDAIETLGKGKPLVMSFKRGKNLLCVTSDGYYFFTIPRK